MLSPDGPDFASGGPLHQRPGTGVLHRGATRLSLEVDRRPTGEKQGDRRQEEQQGLAGKQPSPGSETVRRLRGRANSGPLAACQKATPVGAVSFCMRPATGKRSRSRNEVMLTSPNPHLGQGPRIGRAIDILL